MISCAGCDMNIIQRFIVNNPCFVANVNRQDSRYRTFQDRGPIALMLHSVGCAQPSAMVFADRWDSPSCEVSVHAFIDANSGQIVQIMPWNYRAWHCGGSANNTHCGVEMCESAYIKYTSGTKFQILNKTKAVADAMRAYQSAVELFAWLCREWNLNPMTDIISHKEGNYAGIASAHGDPEHYWKGLGLNYTMNGFRAAVKTKMEDILDMTLEELNALVDQKVEAKAAQLRQQYQEALESALGILNSGVENMLDKRVGKEITHLSDIPSKGVRQNFKPLLDENFINGGTPADVDPEDVYMPYDTVRAMTVMKLYTDTKIRALLEDEPAPPDDGEIQE